MEKQIKYCNKNVSYGRDVEIKRAFEEDGYVVVKDVLTREEIETVLEELWTSPRLLGRPGIKRDDPSSWSSDEWPQQAIGGRNFLNSADVFQDAASWDLCAHPRVVQLQKMLYECDISSAGLGRWGIMRPTADKLEWMTDKSWLHWDQNPWTEPEFVRVQALVCLTDNTETSGGFACVPGFHRSFAKWGRDHPMGTVLVGDRKADLNYGVNQPFPTPEDDPCQEKVVRILAPAGSIVIWDSRLPHQNYPNTDKEAMRIVHYTMMKPKNPQEDDEHRKMLEQRMVVMQALGMKGERFPYALTETAKALHGLSNESVESICQRFGACEELRKAIVLVYEAGKAEESGEVSLAIQKHQRALRMYPDIEGWYGAILR